MKKCLVIVDPQNDFLNPQGSLYVKNNNLATEIYKHATNNEYDAILITLDCHPIQHCSFSEYGGTFPSHCVASTWGCAVCSPIASLYKIFPDKIVLIPKGTHREKEEFGAFGSDSIGYIALKTVIEDSGEDVEFYVCGVAGDYCVSETAKNLVEEYGSDKVYLIMDLIASIDEKRFNDIIVENNFNLY